MGLGSVYRDFSYNGEQVRRDGEGRGRDVDGSRSSVISGAGLAGVWRSGRDYLED